MLKKTAAGTDNECEATRWLGADQAHAKADLLSSSHRRPNHVPSGASIIQASARVIAIKIALITSVQTGSSIELSGEWVASPARGQSMEFQASTIKVLGTVDPLVL